MSQTTYRVGANLRATRQVAAKNDYEPVGDYTVFGQEGYRATTWTVIIVLGTAVLLTLGVLGVVAFAQGLGWNSENLKRINGVPGLANEVELKGITGIGVVPRAGDPINDLDISTDAIRHVNGVPGVDNALLLTGVTGINVTASVSPVNELTVSTDAVRTINGQSALSNDITLTNGGPGITVQPGMTSNVIEILTSAFLQINGIISTAINNNIILIGVHGAEVLTDPGPIVSFRHLLTWLTAGAHNDPLGPQVAYTTTIGTTNPVLPNTWSMSPDPTVGFTTLLVPGVNGGDDGQGNQPGGNRWAVPAIGLYTFYVHCGVVPSNVEVGEHQHVTIAITLGANSTDPHATGFLPIGGIQTLEISTASANDTVIDFRYISLSASAHAGCSGCPANVGDELGLHLLHDVTGSGNPTLSATCSLQVNKMI